MRSSLTSATSLVALLVLQGHAAHATPTVTAGPVATFEASHQGNAWSGQAGSGWVSSGHDGSLPWTDPSSNETDWASGGGFSSITEAPFNSTGNYTFSPRPFGNTSGSIQITDGGPGGTSNAMTLGGADTSDPLETINTARSAPFAGRLRSGDLLPGAGAAATARTNAGAVPGGGSVFTASSGLSSLLEGSSNLGRASSASFGYSFSPAGGGAGRAGNSGGFGANREQLGRVIDQGTGATGTMPTAANVPFGARAPGPAFARTAATGSFAAADVSFRPNGQQTGRHGATQGTQAAPRGTTSTLGYTYTPISRGSASSAVSLVSYRSNFASGSGPAAGAPHISPSVSSVSSASVPAPAGSVFASTIVGSGVNNTPVAVTNGAVGPASSTINFGTIAYGSTNTLDLELENLGTSDMTIEGYTISGGEASAFGASIPAGSVIAGGGTLIVPLYAYGTEVGELTSSLTIFTDQGGDPTSYTYLLDPAVTAPEPASIALLGVGLGVMAGVRRRRRQAS